MNPRARFRELLDRDGVTVAPLVHDALTAKVADDCGFPLIGVTGHGASISFLGLPDAGYTTMSESVQMARNVANAVGAPVFTDIDTGYGNAVGARRTAREIIQHSSAAGFYMEDQQAPKRCGHVAGKQIIPREEAVEKVRAVCDLRDELDEEFVVIARTDSLGAPSGGLDEAVARGNAFRTVGADLVFVDGPTSVEQVGQLGSDIDAPLLYNQGGALRSVSPTIDADELASMGFDVVCFHGSVEPTIVAVHQFLSDLKDDGAAALREFEREVGELPVGDLYSFEGFPEVEQLEAEYLPDSE